MSLVKSDCMRVMGALPSLLFCSLLLCKYRSKCSAIRGVFNNASARSAIQCFLPERKRSPRCLQALAIQVNRCIARKSKMVTKKYNGFS